MAVQMKLREFSLYLIIGIGMSSILVLASPALATQSDSDHETGSHDDETQLKCDACTLLAVKFADAFLTAEEKEKTVRLTDKTVTDAAEGVCDEMWRGYSTVQEDGVVRLAGPMTERDAPVASDAENIWTQRLQDFCDELLAELPSERQLYETWQADHDGLGDYLCKGEGTFSACASDEFGNWPGDDDYDDYDDHDFDYVHDEF